MSKETILEERLKDLEGKEKAIEVAIRNIKIELRRLKAGKTLKMVALKYNNHWKKK